MKSPSIRVAVVTCVVACIASVSGCDRTPPKAASADSTVPAAAPVPAPVQPSNAIGEWTLTEYGIGALRAGTLFTEARDSLQGALVAPPREDLGGCVYVHWKGAPPGVLVMVVENRVARVDVDSAGITTREGVNIGDTEERVQSLYPGRVTVTPHKYTDGHYLTIKSSNPADSLFRLIFETDRGKVSRMRSGTIPAVEYVEGCS